MSVLWKIGILIGVFVFPPEAHAIVVLPAVILIPLVKLIAIVVGAFSVPVTSLGLILGKLTKNYPRMLIVSFLILCIIAIITTLILRKLYPLNPWFY